MDDVTHLPASEPPEPDPRDDAPQALGPLVACVVEDHDVLRDWVVGHLEAEGYVVSAAVATIADGWDVITRERPRLAVIDNHLPDGSGLDLCERLSRECPEVRLVLHTGAIAPADARRVEESGVHAVVLKSLRGNGLVQAIRGDEMTAS
jgi:DNA-binding NarL/FixJ family response regulator